MAEHAVTDGEIKKRKIRLLGRNTRNRPYVRPFTKDDLWIMWAAYDLGDFPNLPKFEGLKKEERKLEFTKILLYFMQNKSSCLIVEDNCKWFKYGRGPVAFVSIENYGWRIEPHVDFFKWATPRIILRCNVAFFTLVKHSEQVGVCLLRSLEKTKNLFDHLKDYGLVFPCGRVPKGDPRGDEYLFYAEGGRNARVDGDRNRVQRNSDDRRPEVTSEGRTSEFPGTDLPSDASRGSHRPPGAENRPSGQRTVYAEALT